MTHSSSRINLAPRIVALVAIVFIFKISLSTEARSLKKNDADSFRTKGTMKTIKSEDGDVIDCVRIYEQPAFDHPLLKNHRIQDVKIKPYSDSVDVMKNFYPKVSQTWNKNKQCPKGTIPVMRTRNLVDYTKSSPYIRRRVVSDDEANHEYVTASTDVGNYYGGHAKLNVWNPQPEVLEFSLVQMWVASDTGSDNDHEAIEVGWHVFPGLYRDSQTRFFIFWTRDNYNNTGCYNLGCPGFVQTNPNIALGGILTPTSVYAGAQSEIIVDVFKDIISGNWILVLDNQVVGYWPGSIFNNLAVAATQLDWGGEIFNINTEHHTTTPMGSGHFSVEGYQKSSYVNEIRVMDTSGSWGSVIPLDLYMSKRGCYDIGTVGYDSFYFGGPGYSNTCP